MQDNNLGQLDPTQNLLIFRSNVTPDITVDLASLLQPGQPPNSAVQGSSALALSLIKPEIVVSALGLDKTIAPYGIPQEGAWTYLIMGLSIATFLGAGLTYSYCTKSMTYAMTSIALSVMLSGIVYMQSQQPVATT